MMRDIITFDDMRPVQVYSTFFDAAGKHILLL
jgi:hypothetical protein